MQINKDTPETGQAMLVTYADSAYLGRWTEAGELLYCKKQVGKLNSCISKLTGGMISLGREYAPEPLWLLQLLTTLPHPEYQFLDG